MFNNIVLRCSALQLVTSLAALNGPNDEPGGRSCRTRHCKATAGHPPRAPSTVAAGNEPSMKPREAHEDGFYELSVTALMV